MYERKTVNFTIFWPSSVLLDVHSEFTSINFVGLDGAAMLKIRDAGIGVFAYDADSFGRSCTSEATRSLVKHKDHLPDDVFTFVQVKLHNLL